MTQPPESFSRRRAVLVLGVSILLAAFFFAGGLVIGRRSVTARLEEPRTPLGHISSVQSSQASIPESQPLVATAAPEIFTVRAASAPKMEDALEIVSKLHELSYTRVSLVVPDKTSVSQNILIEVGPFADRKRAKSSVTDLKSKGFPLAELFAK